MQALGRNDAFMGAAQPRRLAAMLVSRYLPGMAYGMHVDAPIMAEPNHVRSDVSFTLFLNEPDSYEGGELAFESGSGETAFKLPARSAICYATGQLHRVRPVEQGERLAVVGWVQSLVREPAVREMLYDLSEAREQLVGKDGAQRALDLINKTYSNLLRRYRPSRPWPGSARPFLEPGQRRSGLSGLQPRVADAPLPAAPHASKQHPQHPLNRYPQEWNNI